MALTPNTLLDVPALRAVVPLILAAWDDEFLTPAELLVVREALENIAGGDDNVKQALQAWLDPSAPPTPNSLRTMRRAWAKLPAESASGAAIQGLRQLFDLPLESQRERVAPGLQPSASEADIARWRNLLDGEQRATRDEVRALLSDERFRTQRESETGAFREQVLGWVRVLATLPLLERASRDPAGHALGDFLGAFETIALFDLSLVVTFGVQFGLFAGALQNLGTERHHALLPAIRRAETVGCFAMTERAHGSNVRSIQTEARYDAKTREFVIKSPSLAAGKEWIGNAALHARMAVVFAQLHTGDEQYGVHAFLVPIRDAHGEMLPGVRAEDCGHKMGLNGVDNGRLWFDDVRVPRTSLLDRFGQVAEDGTYTSPIPSESKRFFTMIGTLVSGRINVAGGGLAASKVGLAIALRYASQRRQFPDASGVEQPIGDYLTHRLRLLPGLANAYAFSFAQHALVAKIERAQEDPAAGREIGTLAAGLKAIGTWRALDTLQKCRECCGGQGYLTTNRIDGLRTDADVFATFEGDNTVLCQLVAKDLLRDYWRAQGDSPLRSFARAAFADFGASLGEKSPVATRQTDPEQLDSSFQLQALEYRERSLLASLSRRIKRKMGDGLSSQAALEACQDHALSLARAYVERFVLESFQSAVQADALLAPLCSLYALRCIETDLAWFLEHDYVAASKARAIRRHVRELLATVAALALPLVDAFGIPSQCLGPLADPDYLVASGLAPGA